MDELDLLMADADFQGTDEWKAARCGMFTSSRFADLMTNGRGSDTIGLTAKTYIEEVATERITGEPIGGFQGNAATDWGNENEPLAIAEYEQTTGRVVVAAPFVSRDNWTGGSPDGLVDKDGLIEVKCPFNSRYHLLRLMADEPPSKYKWQIQGNLWVTGRDWLDYIDYDPRFPGATRLRVIRVNRDEAAIKLLSKRIELCIELVQSMIQKIEGHGSI